MQEDFSAIVENYLSDKPSLKIYMRGIIYLMSMGFDDLAMLAQVLKDNENDILDS